MRNAVIKAIASISKAFLESVTLFSATNFPKSSSFIALAPRIAGTAAKNENSAALCLLRPKILAPIIVAPERDVPGIIASAWNWHKNHPNGYDEK